MNTNIDPLEQAIMSLGIKKIAEVCCVKVPAVYRWYRRGRLPRTELTGETNYAQLLALETSDISANALLEATRIAWQQQRQQQNHAR
jgi:predicted DNA-binding transcriptional regulator AlpA